MATPVAPLPGEFIHTYHCLCNNLVLATTNTLSTLTRRKAPALDKAYILPCPRLPNSSAGVDSDSDDEAADATSLEKSRSRNYTVLLALSPPARQAPVLVRRSDGLEKRWLLRCGRCKLVTAYQLDWSQFVQAVAEGVEVKKGRREDVLYVLPGAVMTTEEMKQGKVPAEADIDL